MTPNSDESRERVHTWVWILESVAHWRAPLETSSHKSVYTRYLLTPLTLAVSFLPPDWASLVAQTVKNGLQCRRPGFHPCRRSPGGAQGNALQYLALENPLDRGAWWATVHEAAKSRT